jgi:CheY-like chemotaxis protein/nitrogen-specific signal transduction histidine kinase
VIELHGVPHILSITRDISDRKEAEEAILKAKAQAEQANRSKSTFLANMSHEIRTPINGIMGMLQLLQSTPVNDEQKEYVSLALQSAKRLTRLLSDILDLARVEADKMEIALQEFDFRDAIQSMTQLLTPLANEKNLDLLTSLAPEIPEKVMGDPARLQQVLTNLVGNAIKFTNEGHVQVAVQLLATRPDGRLPVLFSISDTGVGISEEELEKLFTPFSQVSEGYARKHQGAGLGLSICKRLVELLDGHISIESEPSVGTTVHFVIPFTPASTGGEDEGTADSTLKPSQETLSILVAEDDQVSSIAIALMLEKLGHNVTSVHDGEEALEALQSGTFDLVFMDVQMPVMDGVEATRRIREGAAGKANASIPIVALTAYAMAGDKERFFDEGMDGYVPKPVNQDKIREEIEKVIKHGPSHSTAETGES